MAVQPVNRKEINDKFWITLGLYVVSMVLVGYAVYTNVTQPSMLGAANSKNAYEENKQLKESTKQLLTQMTKLNTLIFQIDSLNNLVLNGNIPAVGQIPVVKSKIDVSLSDLRKMQNLDPGMKQTVVNTYSKIGDLITSSATFAERYAEERRNCETEKQEMISKHRQELEEKQTLLKQCMSRL